MLIRIQLYQKLRILIRTKVYEIADLYWGLQR